MQEERQLLQNRGISPHMVEVSRALSLPHPRTLITSEEQTAQSADRVGARFLREFRQEKSAHAARTLRQHLSLVDGLLPVQSLNAAIRQARSLRIREEQKPAAAIILARAHAAHASIRKPEQWKALLAAANGEKRLTLRKLSDHAVNSRLTNFRDRIAAAHPDDHRALIAKIVHASQTHEGLWLAERHLVGRRHS